MPQSSLAQVISPSLATSVPADDVLLHRAPMRLIHTVLASGEEWLEADVHTADSSLFAQPDGRIPAWVGIEYMAQAIGAFAGLRARERNEPLGIGFLLGTRCYHTDVATFPARATLQVRVKQTLRDDNNLVLFACEIFSGTKRLAYADVKAIQPDNAEQYIAAARVSSRRTESV